MKDVGSWRCGRLEGYSSIMNRKLLGTSRNSSYINGESDLKYDTFCVTGGAGFAGSHLVDLLLERGAGKVVVVDNFSLGKLENLKDARESGRLQIYCTDACNGVAMDKIFALEKPEACFDLAVKPLPYSFVDPEGACLTSVEMACNLARLLREGKYKRLVHFSSCHDEETRLFTNEGFKHYSEIRGNEEVLTINTNTKDRKPPLEWNRITRVIVEDYDGDLLYFKSNRAEQLVTPNHRVFYETGRGWTKYKLAEDVARLKSPFKLMQGVWAGRDKRTVDLTRFSTGKSHWNSKNLKIPMEVPTEELFYLIGLFVGDGYTDVQLRKHPSKTGLSAKEYVKFRDDKGRFKVVNKINSKKDVTVGTCHRNVLYIPEDDKSRSKVEKCLTSLGLEYHSEPEHCSIYFSSETYHNLFDQCGEGAGNKGFPRWVLDYSPKYLAKLLEGLLDSDGNRKNLISTISPRIVADVAEICEKIGKHSHFFPIESEAVLSGRTIKSMSYCISVSTTSRSIDPLKTTRIKYKGKVWCLEVPNGNFLVERRGTILFSGNSEAYGSAVRIPMSEDHPLNPTTPYGAGKAGADLLLRSYHELFDINMSILRPFNMYGSRQNLGAYAAVIPITIRRILRNEPPILEGSGTQTRDFTYVKDVTEAAVTLMDCDIARGKTMNIGQGRETQIVEVIHAICDEMGYPRAGIKRAPTRLADVDRHLADISLARELLNYRPKVRLEEGIRQTVEWYRGFAPQIASADPKLL